MNARASGSLQTGLAALEVLCSTPAGLGVTELANEIGSDKGNLHRLLRVLAAAGYVEQDPASKHYRATVQIVSLAGNILRSLDLLEIARPVMRELREITGETIHLARRTQRGGIYLAQERPFNRLSVETEIGALVPVYCTSTGKALYAETPRADIESLLESPLVAHTMRTHRTVDALMADLEEVRQRGYAIDDEELNVGIRCLAAPIFNMDGDVAASIGASGPADRITLERMADLGEEIRTAADKITNALGGACLSSKV
jgi:DNA-binding IclR family transcriptional regulator